MTTTGSSVVADVSTLDKSLSHVAPVHAVVRRDGDHRARARRAAAAPGRRPAADGVRGARAGAGGADRVHPRHGQAALAPLRRADGDPDPHPRRLRLDGGRRAHEPLQRGRLRLLGHADRRLRDRPALAGGLRARLAVGARAVHDDRGRELRAALPRVRAQEAGLARARRGVPHVHRPPGARLGCAGGDPLGRRDQRG